MLTSPLRRQSVSRRPPCHPPDTPSLFSSTVSQLHAPPPPSLFPLLFSLPQVPFSFTTPAFVSLRPSLLGSLLVLFSSPLPFPIALVTLLVTTQRITSPQHLASVLKPLYLCLLSRPFSGIGTYSPSSPFLPLSLSFSPLSAASRTITSCVVFPGRYPQQQLFLPSFAVLLLLSSLFLPTRLQMSLACCSAFSIAFRSSFFLSPSSLRPLSPPFCFPALSLIFALPFHLLSLPLSLSYLIFPSLFRSFTPPLPAPFSSPLPPCLPVPLSFIANPRVGSPLFLPFSLTPSDARNPV